MNINESVTDVQLERSLDKFRMKNTESIFLIVDLYASVVSSQSESKICQKFDVELQQTHVYSMLSELRITDTIYVSLDAMKLPLLRTSFVKYSCCFHVYTYQTKIRS